MPLGATLLTLTFIYEVWAFRVITKACAYSNAGNLLDLVHRCYNKHIAIFIDICAVAMLFAVLVCYAIIVSSYIHQAYDFFMHIEPCKIEDEVCQEKFDHTEFIIRLLVGFTLLPLESLINSVKVLNFISSFAIIFVLLTMVCLVIRSVETLIQGKLAFSTLWEPRIPAVPLVPEAMNIFTDFTGMFAMFSL